MSSTDLHTSSHEVELQDRIAKAMFDADLCSGDASRTDWSWAQRLYEQYAQAVIDDLGLEVRRDNLSRNGYRVVGKFVED